MIIAAWARHEGVSFWASFADAWFGPIGAVRDDVFGEDLQQLIEESGLFARRVVGGIEGGGPLA